MTVPIPIRNLDTGSQIAEVTHDLARRIVELAFRDSGTKPTFTALVDVGPACGHREVYASGRCVRCGEQTTPPADDAAEKLKALAHLRTIDRQCSKLKDERLRRQDNEIVALRAEVERLSRAMTTTSDEALDGIAAWASTEDGLAIHDEPVRCARSLVGAMVHNRDIKIAEMSKIIDSLQRTILALQSIPSDKLMRIACLAAALQTARSETGDVDRADAELDAALQGMGLL